VGKYAEVKVQWGAKFLTGIVLKNSSSIKDLNLKPL
jgi:hypothetical protein